MSLFLACALGLSSLCVDGTRIAAFDPIHDRDEVTSRFAALGAGRVEAWPIPGWWLVETREGEPASELADKLACDAGVPFVSPVFTGTDGGPVFATTDLLVRFTAATSSAQQEHVLASLAGFDVVQRRFGAMDRAFRLRSHATDARDVIAAAQMLARRPDVACAEPDCVFTGHPDQSLPNDPLFSKAWGLDNSGQSGGTFDIDVDAPEAWMRTPGSPSVIVAILDTGVESMHPDLSGNMLPGADVTSDGPGIGDPKNAFDSHGTAVAGCLIAVRDNMLGGCGVAPGCKAVSIRTFISVAADGSWTSVDSWTVDALAAAQMLGARVTNNSNSYGFQSAMIDQKYLDLRNAGIVHFASAGNGGTVIDYPANLPTVNAVGSIDRNAGLSSFSNTGPELDFVAPGEVIVTTDRVGVLGWDPTGDYSFVSGTSYAAPFAAGIAALVLSVAPGATPAEVEQILRASCTDLGVTGSDPQFGAGLVNAQQALVLACGSPTTYCTSSPNSVGPGAFMTWSGSQSLSANDLVLAATGVPPNAFGLFFFGTAPIQAPFGNGFRCVGGSVVRLPIVTADAFGGVQQALDVTSLPQGQVLAPGDERRFQLWYRNPAGGGAGFNLSDGLHVRFCP